MCSVSVAAYGAHVLSYSYPDLPVWANSFRASGARVADARHCILQEKILVCYFWEADISKYQKIINQLPCPSRFFVKGAK